MTKFTEYHIPASEYNPEFTAILDTNSIISEMSEDTDKGMIKYRLMDKHIVKRAIDTIAEFSDNVNATNNLYEFLDKDYFHEASEQGYILVDNYKNLKIREELRKCNYSGYILNKFEENYDNARLFEK